jgi:hypothetical protein
LKDDGLLVPCHVKALWWAEEFDTSAKPALHLLRTRQLLKYAGTAIKGSCAWDSVNAQPPQRRAGRLRAAHWRSRRTAGAAPPVAGEQTGEYH